MTHLTNTRIASVNDIAVPQMINQVEPMARQYYDMAKHMFDELDAQTHLVIVERQRVWERISDPDELAQASSELAEMHMLATSMAEFRNHPDTIRCSTFQSLCRRSDHLVRYTYKEDLLVLVQLIFSHADSTKAAVLWARASLDITQGRHNIVMNDVTNDWENCIEELNTTYQTKIPHFALYPADLKTHKAVPERSRVPHQGKSFGGWPNATYRPQLGNLIMHLYYWLHFLGSTPFGKSNLPQ